MLYQRRLVVECLVTEGTGKLVARVYPHVLCEIVLLVKLLGAVVTLEWFGLMLVLLEGQAGKEVTADAADDQVGVTHVLHVLHQSSRVRSYRARDLAIHNQTK